MKLKLSQLGDIPVLEISEDVEAAHVPILRAGIVKFLHSGKNRIVLNLTKVKQFPAQALKEVIALNTTAHELGGSIVTVGPEKLIESSAVRHFSSVELAVGGLIGVPKPTEPAASPAPVPADGSNLAAIGTELSELRAKAALLEKENKILVGKMENREKNSGMEMVKERDALKEQVAALEEQLRALLAERKTPVEEFALRSKVKQLEEALGVHLQKQGQKPAGA